MNDFFFVFFWKSKETLDVRFLTGQVAHKVLSFSEQDHIDDPSNDNSIPHRLIILQKEEVNAMNISCTAR